MKYDREEHQKMAQRFAEQDAAEYFELLEREAKRMLDEVQRYKKRYAEAETPKDKVDVISWMALAAQQFNTHSDQSVRATARLVSAHDIAMY